MASKWINLILWTLVSVNLITLVLGGLVTWLGYAIPVRLKQFGLSPEITQLAGFASLLVACLGLGGLNYSSHYALNAYGLSCAIFIILMLFGVLPDHWQRAVYNPSQSLTGTELHHNQPPAQQHLPTNDTKPVGGLQVNVTSKRLKPDQSHGAGLILDLLYIVLLFVLSVLLALAFTLAQYLRRRELEEVDEADNELVAAAAANTVPDCYDQERGGRSFSQRDSAEWNPTTMVLARRRLLSSMQTTDDLTPDWACTCAGEFSSTNASGINMEIDGHALGVTMAVTNHQANKEFAGSVGQSARPEEDKKSPAVRRMVSSVVEEGLGPDQVGGDDDGHDQADSIRRRSSQSATLDHYATGRRHGNGNQHRRVSRVSSRFGSDTGQLLIRARRASSKSLADLAIDCDGAGDSDGVSNDMNEEEDDGRDLTSSNNRGTANSLKDTHHTVALQPPPLPLVQRGIYHAGGCGLDYEQWLDRDGNQTGSAQLAHHARSRRDSTRQRKRGPSDDHNHYHHFRNRSHCHYHHQNQTQHQQRFRARIDSEAGQCCCSDLALTGCNKAAATLAAKLNPSLAINYDPTFLNNYLQQSHRLGSTVGIRSVYNPNTMPNKGWLQ